MKRILMFFVHHFIRPLWAILIGLVYGLIYFFKVFTSKENKIKYYDNKDSYYLVKSIKEFIAWWNTRYRGKYKSDGYNGLLDHYNTPIEFFMNTWDCDEASVYPHIKFKSLGYESKMIGLLGKKITSWHYDCIVKLKEDEYMLFNQGNCIYGKTEKECLDTLSSRWSIFRTYIYWRCFW